MGAGPGRRSTGTAAATNEASTASAARAARTKTAERQRIHVSASRTVELMRVRGQLECVESAKCHAETTSAAPFCLKPLTTMHFLGCQLMLLSDFSSPRARFLFLVFK